MAAGRRFSPLLCLFLILTTVSSLKSVIELDETNWKQMLQNEWMVEFYAPWCPACKALQPTWKDFASWSEELNIKVAQVDVTQSPGLSGRFMVTALPTIFHVLNGEFRQYRGTRDKNSFMTFITEKKWEKLDPIPSWKSPDSFQMSIVSSFFKFSQVLRVLHNQLMENFGLPSWGSYFLFALATIMLGALLGLILVCIIDLVYPSRQPTLKKEDNKKSSDKGSGDELPDEDIKDDLLDDAKKDPEKYSEEEEDDSEEPLDEEAVVTEIIEQEKDDDEIEQDNENKTEEIVDPMPNVKKRKPILE